jgi:hypothetical protein
MLSARPTLTPAESIATLKRTARPFPTTGSDNGTSDPNPVQQCRTPDGTDQLQCYCITGLCGAGMLDIGAAVMDAAQGVTLARAADQLLDFGERSYPNLFPLRTTTQSSGPFLYRHYPATGLYLGVAVQSDSAYVLGGVYVMGGAWGNAPTFVGRLADFITPR